MYDLKSSTKTHEQAQSYVFKLPVINAGDVEVAK